MIGPPVGGALFQVMYSADSHEYWSRMADTIDFVSCVCHIYFWLRVEYNLDMTSPSSLQIAPSDMLLVSAVNLLFSFVTHIQDISFPVDLVSFVSAHNNSGYYWLLLHPFCVRPIRFNWRVQYDSIARVHGPYSRAPVYTNREHGPCVPSFKEKAPLWRKRSNWVEYTTLRASPVLLWPPCVADADITFCPVSSFFLA